MKCYLFVLGYKGLFVLNELERKGLLQCIECVVTHIIKTEKSYFDDIKEICCRNGIPFCLKDEISKFHKDNNSYAVAIGWKWVIQGYSKIIVFHDSLLPKYRGFNPLVTSLINGDDTIGVSVLYGTNEYDKGDIIYQKSMAVSYPITIWEAIGKISYLYADLCIKVLKDIQSNKSLIAKKQNHAEATYSLWRDRQDYHINWQWDSARIVRFIDAVGFPYDGAKTMFENKILKVLKAEVIKDVVVANRDCGKVIFMENKCCIVVCGIGLVKLCEVVDENGQRWIAPNFRIHFR